MIYDLDWDEDARLAEWQDVMFKTRDLPVVLPAALLLEGNRPVVTAEISL
ncbi:DUF1612 domain-containing protein [Mesorhizobium waimense]|uniref:DUF1612 domain-containing protein n=1 Tax=Mesorhizobium waimense TaxID=1300307 RepID=A0A3A5K007_9HYPH|nr:DUF1612 domain-containing protein [Mesorhizobium waimense]